MFLWLVVAPVPAEATVAESDLVWIVEAEVVPEDLYALGNEVRIAGRVEGDLVAVATDVVRVEGVVTGSVTALASRVVIEGEVGGSLRAAAVEVTVTGRVGGDVLTAAADLEVIGVVERDVLAAVWSAAAGGSVGRDLRGFFRSLELGGRIAGDVEIRTDRLDAEDAMSVLGDVFYQADHLAGQEYLEAGVAGSLINRGMLPPNIRIRAFRLMIVLFMSLLMLVVGLVVVRMVARQTEAAVGRIVRMPLLSMGKGLIFLLSPLLGLAIAGVVVVSLPLYIWGPLLVVAAPFVAVAAGFWLLAALVSHIPVAVATGRVLGRVLGRRWALTPAYLAGTVVFLLALQIPMLGLPVAGVVTGLGAGAWLGKRGRFSTGRPPREAGKNPNRTPRSLAKPKGIQPTGMNMPTTSHSGPPPG